ncbi:MAG: FHA domain-containing protein [Planctomycetaceae bacterium]
MDAVPGRLVVTEGPDAGKSFGLGADLVHIGTGSENQIVLSDGSLAEHQASIASRNGRFAIYVPPDLTVEIEGATVPTEKWVWLPAAATLRMGASTQCRFETTVHALTGAQTAAATTVVSALDGAAAETSGGKEESTPVPEDGRKRVARKKKVPRKANVARFITDQPGETLVKLGEDGQLPDLMLSDTQVQPKPDQPHERNPVVLYAALACSFVMSLGMLLLEGPQTGRGDLSAKSEARQAIKEYFGDDGANFEPYQKELRQALIDAARGDYSDERAHYRRVLQMLNAADIRDPANLNGLTGRMTGRGRNSDNDLREYLQNLLAN